MVCNFLLSVFNSLGKQKCTPCGCAAKFSPKIDDLEAEGNAQHQRSDGKQDEIPEQGAVHKSTVNDAYHHQSLPVKIVNPDVVIERKLSIISNAYGYHNNAFFSGRGSIASIESFKSLKD